MLYSQADAGDSTGENSGGEDTPPLEIRLETSSARAMASRPWAIYVLVNHPRPSEVNVKPPRFPPVLVLERVRTETRLIQIPAAAPGVSAAGNASAAETAPQTERWTRVEFLFTPRGPGSLILEPFEVSVLDRSAVTGTLDVFIREEPQTVRRYEPRFRWVNNPAVPSGEWGELSLELSGWDPQKNVPRDFFRGRTPFNAILEEDPPVPAGEGIYRYAVRVIPLEESGITLEAYSFTAEGFSLTVPEISIRVLPAQSAREPALPEILEENPAPPEGDISPAREIPPEELLSRPFPGYREKVFPLFQRRYTRIVGEVRSLWENGREAAALAEIRRNERDSLPGPFLVPLRGEMERALGLGFTDDERWRPLGFPLIVWAVFGFLALFAVIFLLVFRPWRGRRRAAFSEDGRLEQGVTSRRLGGFKTVIVVVLIMSIAFIFLDEGLSNVLMGDFLIARLGSPGKAAVLEETAAYRVPDLKGAVNVRFGEGQPVTLRSSRGDWCYAESPDGRSGWIRREAVISY